LIRRNELPCRPRQITASGLPGRSAQAQPGHQDGSEQADSVGRRLHRVEPAWQQRRLTFDQIAEGHDAAEDAKASASPLTWAFEQSRGRYGLYCEHHPGCGPGRAEDDLIPGQVIGRQV